MVSAVPFLISVTSSSETSSSSKEPPEVISGGVSSGEVGRGGRVKWEGRRAEKFIILIE